MTLEEKIGQMYESNYWGGFITGPEFDNNDVNILIKKGLVGSIIGLYDNREILSLQKSAVEGSRLHIPLFFSNDIIHGCRTLLPIPLAISCTWNPKLAQKAFEYVAYETYNSGVNVVFSPMVDLTRDPRWGRVMEGNGEDPYLSSCFAKASVKGYQVKDQDGSLRLASCVKHYIGYGAVEGGREYNSVDMSTDTLYNYYLPPFKAAVDSGVSLVMTSFNTFNGIPATANKYLIRDILKKELKFKGVVISDYTSSIEILKHKIGSSEKEVSYNCLMAGLDHEMVARSYINNLSSFKDSPLVLKYIDDAVYRVLRLKYKLGLFNNPYRAINLDFEKYWLHDDTKQMALKVAKEAICLLENRTLPLKKNDKVLFVGPFTSTKRIVGAWGGKSDANDPLTLEEALAKTDYHYQILNGLDSNNQLEISSLDQLVSKCGKIVLMLGEDQWQSGENHSRTILDLPAEQTELLNAVLKYHKPTILMIHAGRPLVLTKYKALYDEKLIDAICYNWFLGTMSSEAIIDTLWGKNNPSGKLTMSFPYAVGQIPVYYNHLPTGRPKTEGADDAYLTKYLDCPNEALYPFGYGLSYSHFKYQNLKLKTKQMTQELSFSIEVLNDSDQAGFETIQVYIECLSDIVSRPVSELKNFKKLWFKPHEAKVVEFNLKRSDLNYYVFGKKHIACGKYGLKVGPNSKDTIVEYFNVL